MGNMNILVIDDDPGVGTLFKSFFQSANCEVHIASNSKQAISFLEMKPYDMVFLDMLLPGKDGLETYREIKAISPNLAVVIMTGRSDNERIEQVVQEGALGCLVKPFGLEAIRDMMIKRSSVPGDSTPTAPPESAQ